MKAPKYVIYTDHLANWNNEDKYIEVQETKFLDVFAKASEMINNDDTLYLIRIYEVVKGTRGKEYKRIANVRPCNFLETQGIDNHIINRYIDVYHEKTTIWYE